MPIENVVAHIVSGLLTLIGISNRIDNGNIINVLPLNHSFIVTPECINWAVLIFACTIPFAIGFLTISKIEGRKFSKPTYIIVAVSAFVQFFAINVLRMFIEVSLLVWRIIPFALTMGTTWSAFETVAIMLIVVVLTPTLLLIHLRMFFNTNLPKRNQ
jgi:hypothetical protein